MSLGFDVYNDERVFDNKPVRKYATASIEYPCFILCASEEYPVPKHSIEALRRMQPTKVGEGEGIVHLYFSQNDMTARLGVIRASQVKSFLTLFARCDIDCFLDAGTKLEGMYMYTLST